MKFSIRFADQIVGVLVILGLAILIAVVFLLGRSQRWFTRDFQYITHFNSAAGLSPNMAVQYKGFTMGRVQKIQLTEADTVEVIFTIFQEYNHRVKEGSIVEVNVSPIGLGSSFVFHPGKGALLQERASKDPHDWAVIPEINSSRAREYIRSGLASRPEASDSISNIINQVNMLLETINVSLGGSSGSEAPALGQIVTNVEEVTANLAVLVQSISDQITPILANIETITGDVSDQLPPILTNVETLTDDLSTQINPILSNVEKLTDQIAEPSGTVMSILDSGGPIYSDLVELLDSVTGILRSLEKVVDFVPGQLPQVALLLSNVQSTLVEVEKVVISLTNNPLLKGGVPVIRETGPGAVSPRNLEF